MFFFFLLKKGMTNDNRDFVCRFQIYQSNIADDNAQFVLSLNLKTFEFLLDKGFIFRIVVFSVFSSEHLKYNSNALRVPIIV